MRRGAGRGRGCARNRATTGVRAEWRDQLDVRVADVEQRRLDALVGDHRLAVHELEPERVEVEGQRRVELGNRDTGVIDRAEHVSGQLPNQRRRALDLGVGTTCARKSMGHSSQAGCQGVGRAASDPVCGFVGPTLACVSKVSRRVTTSKPSGQVLASKTHTRDTATHSRHTCGPLDQRGLIAGSARLRAPGRCVRPASRPRSRCARPRPEAAGAAKPRCCRR